jgi:hypothetical protein
VLDLGLLDDYLQRIFSTKLYKRLIERIERWAFIAEPLNPAAYPKGNTKQLSRWEIPRELYPYLYTTADACLAVKNRLLAQIVFMKDAPPSDSELREQLEWHYGDIAYDTLCPLTDNRIAIADIQAVLNQTSRIGRSELNVDFVPLPKQIEKLEIGNLHWIPPPYHLYCLRTIFSAMKRLLAKVQTKAYLTDRRQTGDFPANRERRWEIHPRSPQFASYSECIRIEVKLLAQILEFSGAPTVDIDRSTRTQIESILGGELKPGSFRCPISGQFIEYQDFIQAADQPKHGRSQYQVAHITPLAVQDGKHIAENASWITELGNRVQGEDALDDIVDRIFQMASYHKERLGLTWKDVEKKVKLK